jgi:hypothetical protein
MIDSLILMRISKKIIENVSIIGIIIYKLKTF